jgi:hypothetical protein
METTKHHNFHLGFKNKLEKGKKQSLYVMYKYGNGTLHKRVTPIKLLGSYWDKESKHLTKKLQKNEGYSSEVNWLDTFYTAIKSIQIEMDKGDMTLETAWSIIFNRNPKGLIKEFLENYSKLDGTRQRNKYLAGLKGIENRLPNELKPISFRHIQDSKSILTIATALTSSKLKNTTIGDYMKVLDYVSREAELKLKDPFKSKGLKPKPEAVNKRPREYKGIMNGMNKVSTKKDFLALNLFLYSLCLRGLNGSDICCLSEDWIGSGAYEDAYLPDHIIDPQAFGNLSSKTYLSRKRGKSTNGREQTILINLLPTYLLHQSLKQLVKEEYPQYAYQGNDKLRLFNFTTKDVHYQPDEEGIKNWEAIKDTLSKKIKNITGEGLNNARHTFTSYAEATGISDDDQRKLIGQRAKGALSHYQSRSQIKMDLNHIQVLDEIKILKITKGFFDIGYSKGFLSQYLTPYTKHLLEEKELMRFSAEDELRLMQMTADWEDKGEFELIDGVMTAVEEPKPDRLVNLERQKAALLVVRDLDSSWSAQATDKITGFITKEQAANYTDAWVYEKSIQDMESNPPLIVEQKISKKEAL